MERSTAKNLARRISGRISVLLLAAMVGCSGGESDGPSDETAANSTAGEDIGTPEQTVHDFMMAFKNGDDEKASHLVTEKTRQEMERTQFGVAPLGSKEMQFKVGAVRLLPEAKGAHVECQIIDGVDAEGEAAKFDVVWFLRKEQPGWRVAGVAMQVFPDQIAVIYNFEDMDDMQRKIELVQEEMVRRATQTLTGGQPPANGAQNPIPPAADVAELQMPANGTRK